MTIRTLPQQALPCLAQNLLSSNLIFFWERHLAAMIVAGSHSHKKQTFLVAK
jgi:hypothetical protein